MQIGPKRVVIHEQKSLSDAESLQRWLACPHGDKLIKDYFCLTLSRMSPTHASQASVAVHKS